MTVSVPFLDLCLSNPAILIQPARLCYIELHNELLYDEDDSSYYFLPILIIYELFELLALD